MKLTILHLSDIHIHDSTDSVLRQANQIASSCFTNARDSDICLIMVSGDIAFSGQAIQYQEAESFLVIIKKSIQNEGCPLVDIITVPGNHDCILVPENRARTLIIKSVIKDPEEASDDNVITTCTASQKYYFEFQYKVTERKAIFEHKLWHEYEFTIDGKSLRISAINAAWMSQLKEEPGQLVFPISLFNDQLEHTVDIRIALLHHPLNWYCQHSYHSLRKALRNHAHIILSGHEHLPGSSKITDNDTGSCLYFEAAALQPHEKNLDPSFSVFFLSLDENNIDENKYIINADAISKQNQFSQLIFDATSKNNGNYELTKDFRIALCDPGGNFTHPKKDKIDLDDIFVFPEVKKISSGINDKGSFISIEKIIFRGVKDQNILILGEEKSGKSTVLYRTFNKYHSSGLLPIYIKACEFSSSSDREIKKIIDKQVKSQYLMPSKLDLASKKMKIAIVDDIHKMRGGSKVLYSVIQYLEKHFMSVILTANSEFELASLIDDNASNALASYEGYEIQRFNSRLRYQLIKKWCLCGSIDTKPELDKSIHRIEQLLDTVLGKNLVPSQPIYLLILIQSCQNNQQNELQNSSFAYYYQYIIIKSFGEVGVKREELDALFNYLSNYAWFMCKGDKTEIALQDADLFNKGFCDEFDNVDLKERLNLLCSAKILTKRGDYYSFTYPYIYFYFLGKYLAYNLYKEEIKQVVEDYCDSLHKYHNTQAILFLTHHDNNHPWILERILSVLINCFKGCNAMSFNDDTKKINTLITTTTHVLIAEPDVDKNQVESRKIKDNFENTQQDEDYEIEEQVSFSSNINLLFRTAEILGQILKNYYGSLDRPMKRKLINEIFDSPLRLLGAVLETITNDPMSFVKELEVTIEKERPNLPNKKKEEIARKFTFNLLGFISTGFVLRTAQFVSSSKLREDISTVVKNNPTNAYKLIEAATYLSQPGDLPLEDIRKFAKDLKDNSFVFKMLQSLGVYHFYQFHMREIDKQKLCSALEIQIDKSHKIDYQSNRSKLLKK